MDYTGDNPPLRQLVVILGVPARVAIDEQNILGVDIMKVYISCVLDSQSLESVLLQPTF